MGFRAYEQRPLAYHLATPVSASEMRRRGWVAMARCQACQLDLRIDLDLMVRLNGPELILFGRTCRCRRLGCSGRMVFMGTRRGSKSACSGDCRSRPTSAQRRLWDENAASRPTE